MIECARGCLGVFLNLGVTVLIFDLLANAARFIMLHWSVISQLQDRSCWRPKKQLFILWYRTKQVFCPMSGLGRVVAVSGSKATHSSYPTVLLAYVTSLLSSARIQWVAG